MAKVLDLKKKRKKQMIKKTLHLTLAFLLGALTYLLSFQALAVNLEYTYNGTQKNVRVDTGSPGNTRAYPFWYYNAAGTLTDLATQATAASQLTSLQLIDNIVGTDGGASTSGVAAIAGFDGANTQVLKTDVTGSLQVDVESSALPTGAATEAKQDTQITHLSNIETDTGNMDTSLNAIEASASSIDGKLNLDFGLSSGALRSASQIGNATGAADFNAGASGAQTLRASANIMRDGNALSYNDGASDANSLRTSSNVKFDGTTPSLNAGATGAATQRVSANIMRDGNALDYNSGNVSANTLRVVPATDTPEAANNNESVNATGSAVPSQATAVAGSDGTNLRMLKTTSDGTLVTNATVSSSGTVTHYSQTGTTLTGTNSVTIHTASSAANVITKVSGYVATSAAGSEEINLIIGPTAGAVAGTNGNLYFRNNNAGANQQISYDNSANFQFDAPPTDLGTVKTNTSTATPSGLFIKFTDHVLPPGYTLYVKNVAGTTDYAYEITVTESTP